jgi:hypothetical protein
LTTTVDTIASSYDIIYDKIFVLEDANATNDLMCTYNIEESNNTINIALTISLHRKKKTNTLYTINALNEAIKLNNNGILDKSFQLNWEVYSDCILLVNDAGLKKINTAVKEIIRIKTK